MEDVRALQGVGDHSLLAVVHVGKAATVYRAVANHGAAALVPAGLEIAHAGLEPAEADRFEARRRNAIGLAHPRIVCVREVGWAGDRPYAVGDLAEGVWLDEIIARRWGVEAATALCADLLEALVAAEAHATPLGHGGLSRGELLVDPEGGIRVAGFGEPGPVGADLAALAALVRPLAPKWPEPLDAWLARAADTEAPFPTAKVARETFPGAPSARGRKRLARLAEQALARRAALSGEDPVLASGAQPAPVTGQARAVVWLCVALAFAAICLEVFRYVG